MIHSIFIIASLLNYTCEKPHWDSANINEKIFVGTLQMSCQFQTRQSGDYLKLKNRFIETILKEDEVHSGPKELPFEGLPGVVFDITTEINEEGLHWLRTNTHVAGDGRDHFSMASYSTEIGATGFAANLLKMDNITRVERGAGENSHVVDFSVTSHVKKSPLVSEKQFKKIVMEKTETKLVEKTESLISALAEGME